MDSGCRIPRLEPQPYPGADERQESVLILGDSVAFGSGVDEEESFAGLLRSARPATAVYNSAVIGYGTHDHKNVIERFPLFDKGIDTVVLVFCLNDVSPVSSLVIDSALKPVERSKAEPEGLVAALKEVRLVARFNEYLRPRSKLYLLVKNSLTDAKERQAAQMMGLYADGNRAELESSMRSLEGIAAELNASGVRFHVVILPYQFQVASRDPRDQLPQERVAGALAAHGVGYTDALPWFRREGTPAGDLFLRFDEIHLSPRGHAIVQRIITGVLDAS